MILRAKGRLCCTDQKLTRRCLSHWTRAFQGWILTSPVLRMTTRVLRPHQIEGVRYIYECLLGISRNTSGCILADEMFAFFFVLRLRYDRGLGKTLQTLCVIWTLLRQGPFGFPSTHRVVVVTPSSLVKVAPVKLTVIELISRTGARNSPNGSAVNAWKFAWSGTTQRNSLNPKYRTTKYNFSGWSKKSLVGEHSESGPNPLLRAVSSARWSLARIGNRSLGVRWRSPSAEYEQQNDAGTG